MGHGRQEKAVSERIDIGFYYVIDKDGVIFWNYLSPVEVNPGADGILAASTDCKNEKGGR